AQTRYVPIIASRTLREWTDTHSDTADAEASAASVIAEQARNARPEMPPKTCATPSTPRPATIGRADRRARAAHLPSTISRADRSVANRYSMVRRSFSTAMAAEANAG